MGGQSTQSTTSSTAPSNPQVTKTLNQLLGGIQTAYAAGPTTVGAGPTTKNAWQTALNQAGSPAYGAGVNSAQGDVNTLLGHGGLSDTQTGAMNDFTGMADDAAKGVDAPGYKVLRDKLSNDVLTSTNAAFNNSGLFGSDNNQTAAALGLTEGLGGLDYQQYSDQLARRTSDLNNASAIGQQGVGNEGSLAALLPTIYNAGELPASTEAGIGAAQDTNTQNLANKNINLLGQLSSILQGNAQVAGQTTTNTVPVPPWWQQVLGYVVGNAGQALTHL